MNIDEKILAKTDTKSSEQIIHTDVMRYKRNKLPANLAFLSLAFECLYFMLFYAVLNTSYYAILIGIDVIINLGMLLLTFLAEEGIKNYQKNYAWLLLIIGIVQIARIFLYPLDIALGGNYLYSGTEYTIGVRYFGAALGNAGVSTILIIWLVLSAAAAIASAVLGYIKSVQYHSFNNAVNSGAISIEAALKDLDEKDAAAVSGVATPNATEEG